MAFERDHSPEILEALRQAHSIAKRTGGIDHLKAKAKMVQDALVIRETVPTRIQVRKGSSTETFEVSRKFPKAAVRRTIKTADLKRMFPLAYSAAVTISAPKTPYQLRLDPEFIGKPSKEWSEEKAAGAANWTAVLEQRYGDLSWDHVDTQARVLYELRRDIKDQTDRLETARGELMLYITDHALPLVIRGHGDGRLVLRENGPRTSIDYDILERHYPAAAALIKRTTVPGVPQIRFYAYGEDPNEGDRTDDEESVRGIWK